MSVELNKFVRLARECRSVAAKELDDRQRAELIRMAQWYEARSKPAHPANDG